MNRIIIALALSLFMASAANAATIAAWDMYGQPGDQAYTAGIDSAYATAFDMVRGADLNAAGAGNSMSSNGWSGSDADDYFQFGFSVVDGYAVTLNDLYIGTRSSNTGPGTIGVYTSLDGYTNAIYTISQQGTAYSNSIIDLSSLGVITGDLYIRLYEIGDTQADGSGATSGGGTFRITDYYDGDYTDVSFFGDAATAAVPVPAAVWLLASGLAGLFIRRK